MMRFFALPLVLAGTLAALAGCDLAGGNDYDTPLVPDSTVFIVSALEYSPDTLFHHRQVYVGYVSDPLDPRYRVFYDPEHKPGLELWHPVTWAQVGMKLQNLKLRPDFETEAEVTITGPLGRAGEQTVAFTHERRGVYGDLAHALVVLPRERYRLDVRLPDGRRYTAETHVPSAAEWSLPDTLRVSVSVQVFTYAYTHEDFHIESDKLPLDWTPAPRDEATLSVFGTNGSLEEDYRFWGLIEGESLPYEDRNDYVRRGKQYVVWTTAVPDPVEPGPIWSETDATPLVEWQHHYLRLYQLSPELALYYASEDIDVTHPSGDPWAVRNWNVSDIVDDRDTTYFPSISNILRVGPDGQPLPKAESDAVGIFGGFSARYAYRVMLPVRDFDPAALGWPPPVP